MRGLRKAIWMLGLASAVSGLACNGGSGDPCADLAAPCADEGEERCAGDLATSERCAYDADGCLGWRVDLHCAAPEVCTMIGAAATCARGCEDACTAGATRCSGEAVQTCAADALGCLSWTTTEDCAATGLVCQAIGAVQCVEPCQDSCPAEGTRECQGDVLVTCVRLATGCLGWDAGIDCTALDPPQVCVLIAGTPACAALGGEDCENGQDDDGDLLADCEDPDCFPVCTCHAGNSLTQPGTVTGSNDQQGDDSSSESCGQDGGGQDVLYCFTAPVAAPYSFDTFGSEYDTVLYLLDPAGGELACNDDGENLHSRVVLALGQGQQVWVVVDAYDADAVGLYVLNIAPVEDCGNGLDDDGDGHADCLDEECAWLPACLGQTLCTPANTLTSPARPAATGNNAGLDDRFWPDCLSVAGGLEAIYCFTPPSTAHYEIDAAGTEYEHGLLILDALGQELGCAAGNPAGPAESVLALQAGEAVIIILDANGSLQVGDYVLNIWPFEECTGGLDEDGDGLADCEDPDCEITCGIELSCGDWADNEGDGLFDCSDPTSCSDPLDPSPACVPVESLAAGSPCAASSQCAASALDPICLTEELTYFPAGYCSEFCQLAADDCPAGAICVDLIGLGQAGLGLCLDQCDPASATPCRGDQYPVPGIEPPVVTSYVCANPVGSAGFVCLRDDLASEWSCDDAVDNDSDGSVDCDDEACLLWPGCLCDGVTPLEGEGAPLVAGDISAGSGAATGSCGGWGAEVAFCYRADQTGIFQLDTIATELDTVLYVLGAAGELACNDDADPYSGLYQSLVTVELLAGETVTVVVDTYGPTVGGAYALSITLVGK